MICWKNVRYSRNESISGIWNLSFIHGKIRLIIYTYTFRKPVLFRCVYLVHSFIVWETRLGKGRSNGSVSDACRFQISLGKLSQISFRVKIINQMKISVWSLISNALFSMVQCDCETYYRYRSRAFSEELALRVRSVETRWSFSKFRRGASTLGIFRAIYFQTILGSKGLYKRVYRIILCRVCRRIASFQKIEKWWPVDTSHWFIAFICRTFY